MGKYVGIEKVKDLQFQGVKGFNIVGYEAGTPTDVKRLGGQYPDTGALDGDMYNVIMYMADKGYTEADLVVSSGNTVYYSHWNIAKKDSLYEATLKPEQPIPKKVKKVKSELACISKSYVKNFEITTKIEEEKKMAQQNFDPTVVQTQKEENVVKTPAQELAAFMMAKGFEMNTEAGAVAAQKWMSENAEDPELKAIVGRVTKKHHIATAKKYGVSEVFATGTAMQELIDDVKTMNIVSDSALDGAILYINLLHDGFEKELNTALKDAGKKYDFIREISEMKFSTENFVVIGAVYAADAVRVSTDWMNDAIDWLADKAKHVNTIAGDALAGMFDWVADREKLNVADMNVYTGKSIKRDTPTIVAEAVVVEEQPAEVAEEIMEVPTVEQEGAPAPEIAAVMEEEIAPETPVVEEQKSQVEIDLAALVNAVNTLSANVQQLTVNQAQSDNILGNVVQYIKAEVEAKKQQANGVTR